jgi:hypothetical protein
MCFYSSDPTAKILIVGDEDRIPYMRPPLSKVGLPCSFWPPGSGSLILDQDPDLGLAIYQILGQNQKFFFF